MTINYRTVGKDSLPQILSPNETLVCNQISVLCLVWQRGDSVPCIAHYEPNRKVWNNFYWRQVIPITDGDKWVYIDDLEPRVRTMSEPKQSHPPERRSLPCKFHSKGEPICGHTKNCGECYDGSTGEDLSECEFYEAVDHCQALYYVYDWMCEKRKTNTAPPAIPDWVVNAVWETQEKLGALQFKIQRLYEDFIKNL